MSQHQKLLDKFLKKPKDFTWDYDYKEITGGRTGGSRRRFVHETLPPITLHKPHPGNELKSYQITQVIAHLKAEQMI